jgi:hypothetical protein
VADAGITYVISEWNRPENRGMFNALQPMTAWNINNKALKNPCNDKLEPTQEATSDLKKEIQLDKSNNRIFKITRVSYRDSDGKDLYSTEPDSNLAAPESVNLLDVAEAVITVEGTYKKGSLTSTARATKGFKLDTTTSCGGGEGDKSDSEVSFSFGGSDPSRPPNLSGQKPTYYTQGVNQLVSTPVTEIYCSPISDSSHEECPKADINGIQIRSVPLSNEEKKLRNPPSLSEIAEAAQVAVPPAQTINTNSRLTIDGTGPSCIIFNNASHCNINSITMAGNGVLTIDTSQRPVYLYITGDIRLRGNADISHKIKYINGQIDPSARPSALREVKADFYQKDLEQFEKDAFRLQIIGNKVTGTPQSFDFGGVPSANLLYWAPNADLLIGGNANALASAIFVNHLSNTGNAKIELISQPKDFGFSNPIFNSKQDGPGERRRTVAARSTTFSQYF